MNQGVHRFTVRFIPLFIQAAGSLAAVSQPGHILVYAPRRAELAAFLQL